MKILLIAIGTRGDVEPFLALGEILRDRGHEITCQFPEQFRELAENSNLGFEGLTSEFLDLLDSSDGKMVMGGKGKWFEKLRAYYNVYKKSLPINFKMLNQQHELVQSINPDRVLYSAKATYAVVWEITHPGKTINVSPIPYLIHKVNDHGHLGFNGNYGTFLNGLTYKFVNYMLAKNIINSTKDIRAELNISSKEVQDVILTKKMIYTLSQVFFKPQEYWPPNVKVLGYHERNVTSNWEPSEALKSFIDKHDRILFLTFGSMTNPNPEEKTRIMLSVLSKQKIPAIINVAVGGLVIPEEYDTELFHFVNHIPYEWVLPKMYAVVHHGGSGTSHLAIKYGCSSMIIPHILDQFIWNDLYTKIGVGPEGIGITKITEGNIAPRVKALFKDSKFKEKAQELALQMQADNFSSELIDTIEN